MTNFLEQVLSGVFGGPERILLYGTQGIGKSTWAASAPKAIFLPTEDGLGKIHCDKFPLAKSLDEVMKMLGDLYTGTHEYKTLVIDSLDCLERYIWQVVAQEKGKDNIEDIGYAKGYTFALNKWRDVLDGLTALHDDREMAIILISHSKIERFESPDTDSFDRYAPSLHKLAANMIGAWVDEILFASYKVYVKKADDGKRTQGVGSGERILRTTERPSHIAKNRLNLPDELPLKWSEFENFLPIAVKGAV